MSATSARIQCSACSRRQFRSDLEVNAHVATLSPAIREGRALALAKSNETPSAKPFPGENKIRQRRYADAFLLAPEPKLKPAKPTGETASFGSPLISIGPHTDAMLDRFKMGDVVLLRLHELVGSVRSSRWEAVLRSSEFGLTYDEASTLTSALLMDIRGAQSMVTKAQVFFPHCLTHSSWLIIGHLHIDACLPAFEDLQVHRHL
jgi:hypothetical protein